MRINKEKTIILIVTLIITILIILALLKTQPSNIVQLPKKSPSVYQLKTQQIELSFVANPGKLKVGETATVKLILTSTNSAKLQNMVYTIKIPDEFEVKKDSVKVLNSPESFLSGFVFEQDSPNKITAYMVNYPSTDTKNLFHDGIQLASFNVKVKSGTPLGSYNIGFITGNKKDQFINKNNENILGNVQSTTITVVASTLDLIKKPTVEYYTPTTYNLNYYLQGEKSAGTGIMLNGKKVINESDAENWETKVDLTKLGNNIFKIQAYKGDAQSTPVVVEIFRRGIADLRLDSKSPSVDVHDLGLFAGSYHKFKQETGGVIKPTDKTGYRLSDMAPEKNGVYGDGILNTKDISAFIRNWKNTYTYE